MIDGQECKGAQFADDFWLALTYDRLNEVIKELEQFRNFSGLKDNYNKSAVLPIGNTEISRQPLRTSSALKWSNDPIKILSIMVHPDVEIMSEINYSSLL